MTKDSLKKRTDGLQSFERGLSIILAFDRENPTMTIGTASERTGLDRAIVRRALLSLVNMGFAKQDGRAFQLTPRILRLAAPYFSGNQFVDVAQFSLKEFVDEFGISASVCVLDETEIVYVARVETRRLIRLNVGLGSRLPAHLTALGRVLLASLPTEDLGDALKSIPTGAAAGQPSLSRSAFKQELKAIRQQGYAFVQGELEGGLIAIAVPILDSFGTVVAAVGCSTHVGHISASEIQKAPLDALRAMALSLSESSFSRPSL